MKRIILPVLILCLMLALGACGAPATVNTAAGEFETSQDTMATIEDGHGNALAASPGNILLVIYLKPADGNGVTEDEACNYFYSGSRVVVGGQNYDMKCISLEKAGGRVRYGLVFDIVNSGYSDQNKPDAVLQLPDSMPQTTPEPTATPLPAPVVTTAPALPTESAEASPTDT